VRAGVVLLFSNGEAGRGSAAGLTSRFGCSTFFSGPVVEPEPEPEPEVVPEPPKEAPVVIHKPEPKPKPARRVAPPGAAQDRPAPPW
jgi:outer membrane biosynthesis protein TonB